MENPVVIRRNIKQVVHKNELPIEKAELNQVKQIKANPPKEEKLKRHWETIKSFVENESETIYEFSPDLDNVERKGVHAMADEFGLLHYSRGTKVRYITLEKKNNVKADEWQYFGYIGLLGPSIDHAVDDDTVKKLVPPNDIQKRIKRDGPISHITLINGKEEVSLLLSKIEFVKGVLVDLLDQEKLKEIENKHSQKMDALELLMDLISEVIIDDWKDLGLGRVQSTKNQAWFKVIEWPSAAEFRKRVGLPAKDFHITVGYAVADIHHVPKDRTTLVDINQIAQINGK